MVVVAEAGWASLLLGASFNGAHRPPVDLPFPALALPAVAGVALAAWGGQLTAVWRARLGWPRPAVPPARFGSFARTATGSTTGTSSSSAAAASPRPWVAGNLRGPMPATGRGPATPTSRWAWLGHWPQGLRWPAGWRAELLALLPVGIVGIALTAGLISELSISGSVLRVATDPWSSVGHRPAVVAGGAWFVAILAWCRGVWLGGFPLSSRHAVWSLGLSTLAYVGIFAGRAADHQAAFRAATGASGWLFFVSFPLGAAAVALVHQRDLERQVLTRASSRPTPAWVAVLALPLVGVTLIGLLVAALVGPAAPVLGQAVTWTAKVIWSGLEDAARWLWGILPRGHPNGKVPILGKPQGHTHGAKAPPVPVHSTFTIPDIVGEVLVALVVLAILIYLFRHVHFPRFGRPAAVASDEERDSLFSWQHLIDQLRAALRRLLRRLWPRRRRALASTPRLPPMTTCDPAEAQAQSVRDAYRRLLVAAREAGAPRAQTETTHELARRFVQGLELDADATVHLRRLTRLYESVRYGSAPDTEAERATADVEVVIPALRLALDPPVPSDLAGP